MSEPIRVPMPSKMEAGRELDALIAERVMGCEKRAVAEWKGGFAWVSPDGHWWGVTSMPAYSTDISAAWEVVEKMKQRPTQAVFIDFEDSRWSATMSEMDGYYEGAGAETAPLAICRAALKAAAPTHDSELGAP